MSKYVEGLNYRIDLTEDSDGRVATYKVWRRPDLDSATGARLAEEGVAHVHALFATGRADALAYDLTEAPPVLGPRTEAAVREAVRACAKAGKPVLFLLADHAVLRQQCQQIIKTVPNASGETFGAIDQARAWLRARRR
jgi:hypothetical protein